MYKMTDYSPKQGISGYSSGPQMMNMANLTMAPCAIIMVGLPARGKTYMAKKLSRYLNWIGVTTKAFSVGDYRRKAAENVGGLNELYNPNNEEAGRLREQCKKVALEDLKNFLLDKGEVAVFDATNGMRSERNELVKFLSSNCGFKVFFIESICVDDSIVEANILQVKVNGPGYDGINKEQAVLDYKAKIKHLEGKYEPISEELDRDISFMKVIDQGRMFLVNKLHGHVESRVVYYLMNIHILPRTIYLTRHGESMMNLAGRIGGDGELSENGMKFAKVLAQFVKSLNKPQLKVWTSLMKRTVQTASFMNNAEHWKALNEIDAGVCEGMTYQEIHTKYPEEFAKRDADKYNYRYPGGESYHDLVARLEPVIMELERQGDVLVICHQAVARCLLAYFLDEDQSKLPYLEVPLHTVVKLTPVAYGCEVEYISLNVKAVNTHRPLPTNLDVNRSAEEALATVPPTPSFNCTG